jgi:hypothetical protein
LEIIVNEERLRLIEKVKKLFSMAHQSVSPEEARVAATRAQEILQKYDMSVSELEIKEEGFQNCSEHNFDVRKLRTQSWVVLLHGIIGKNFDVAVVRRMHGNGTSFLFLGVEPDVTVAIQTFEYLYNFVETYDFTGLPAKDRYDWRLGFVFAVKGRLYERKKQQNINAHITDLVLCKNQIAKDYLSSKYKNLKKHAAKTRDVGASYFDGFQVGRNVPINRPLDEAEEYRIS